MTAPLEPEIREFPRTKIVGLEQTFQRDTLGEIPDLWKTFHSRMHEIPLATGLAAYGVSVMRDRVSLTIDYLAAAEVTEAGDFPDGMTSREIGGGLAAVFTVSLQGRGIGAEIGAAYDEIWREWMPTADYVPSGGYDFERYDSRFDPATLCGALELVIPVKPRAAGGA